MRLAPGRATGPSVGSSWVETRGPTRYRSTGSTCRQPEPAQGEPSKTQMRADLTENASPLRGRGLRDKEDRGWGQQREKKWASTKHRRWWRHWGWGQDEDGGRGSQDSASEKEGAPISESWIPGYKKPRNGDSWGNRGGSGLPHRWWPGGVAPSLPPGVFHRVAHHPSSTPTSSWARWTRRARWPWGPGSCRSASAPCGTRGAAPACRPMTARPAPGTHSARGAWRAAGSCCDGARSQICAAVPSGSGERDEPTVCMFPGIRAQSSLEASCVSPRPSLRPHPPPPHLS